MILPRRPAVIVIVLCLAAALVSFFSFRFNGTSSAALARKTSSKTASSTPRKLAAPTNDESSTPQATANSDLPKFRLATRWGKEKEPALLAFSEWTQRYLASAPADRLVLEKEGVLLAKKRHEKLRALIHTQPKLAVAETVPFSIRNQLPDSITSLLEERVSGRGNLLVLGRADAEGGDGRAPTVGLTRRVQVNGRDFEAFVYGDRQNQRTLRNISLHGIALEGELALSDSPLRVLEEGEPIPANLTPAEPFCLVSGLPSAPTASGPRPGAIAAASGDKIHWLCSGGHLAAAAGSIAAAEAPAFAPYATFGSRSVIVMLVDFPDLPGGPTTVSQAQINLGSVAAFIQDNSFHQISFDTQRILPTILRMPSNSTTYTTQLNGDTQLLDDARNAARAAGFDPATYDFDVVAFANINFPWAGQGYVGEKGAWVQGSLSPGTLAHELGHNLGVWHANSWISSSTVGATGTHDEYGNPFDVMGRSSGFPENHYNANFKYLFGWLPATNIETVTQSGTFRIYAHDQGSKLDGRKYAVRIPVGLVAGGEVEDYWIDFRQLPALRYPATDDGAIIQWGNDAGTQSANRLLDTTPSTFTMEDAPLTVGRTLNDPANSLAITTLQKSGTGPDAFIDLQINLSLPTSVTLQDALDAPDLTWTTSTNAWVGLTSITHDGVDAASSGPTHDNESSYIETTVTGPGSISFWWKVSSEADFDFLRLLIDDVETASISGEIDWQSRTYDLTAGSHTIRWVYQKDGSALGGSDRAWLDQVSFSNQERAPQINFPPSPVSVAVGETATFRVDAGGTQPLTYQWFQDQTSIPNATNALLTLTNVQFTDATFYSVVVSNAIGSVRSDAALLTVLRAISLGEAVDFESASWTSTGAATWRGETGDTHDGIDAAQSGAIGNNAQSSMETTVIGPGTLSFWWKVSSEDSFDFLGFYIDNDLQEQRSGEGAWAQKIVVIPNGSHRIRWLYQKDTSVSEGSDAGWVDSVQFETSQTLPPIVVTQPVDEEVSVGGSAEFTVTFMGSDPLEFQWYRNDAALTDRPGLAGSKTATLTISHAQSTDAGKYSVLITNPYGSTNSASASLSMTALSLGDGLDQPTRVWLNGGNAFWKAETTETHDDLDAVASPPIADKQQTSFQTEVTGPGTVSFWWKVESEDGFDFLALELDGTTTLSISGLLSWQRASLDFGPGNHTLRWVYKKDGNTAKYRDMGWVDSVEITSPPPPPRIDNLSINADSISGVVQPLTPFSGNIVIESSTDLSIWTALSTNQITSTNYYFQTTAGPASKFLRAKVQ